MPAVGLIGRRAEARAGRPFARARARRLCCGESPVWERQHGWSMSSTTRTGCRILRAAGVQAEMKLAFAGLRQGPAPVAEHVGSLPVSAASG